MKEQYVGDISDYRKYALLRALAAGGSNRTGVSWMLTPSDGSTDGGKLAYLAEPEKHRAYDPKLFDILAHAAAEPDRRRLQTIEDGNAIPGARYFNEPLSDVASERQPYMDACLATFADTDLVFFDPDNGLEVPSLRVGRKNSSKYVYLEEVRAFFEAGKSVLIYQHFPRMEREAFVASCAERLRAVAPDAALWAFRTKHVVFLLLVHPGSRPSLAEAANEAATRWEPKFISGAHIPPNVAEDPIAQFDNDDNVAEPEQTVSSPSPLATHDELAEGDELAASEPSRPSLIKRILRRLQ